MHTDSVPVATVLLFILLFAAVLRTVSWLLQHGPRRLLTDRSPAAHGRHRIAHLLRDDIGQKIAAARVNLSALRMHLRTSGVPESAELDAAMELLDDGCRDLRTVSRLIESEEAGHVGTGEPDVVR